MRFELVIGIRGTKYGEMHNLHVIHESDSINGIKKIQQHIEKEIAKNEKS